MGWPVSPPRSSGALFYSLKSQRQKTSTARSTPDEFRANGAALEGLCDLGRQSGATLVGAGIAVEKCFQPGGARLRAAGLRIESLARIKSMSDSALEFMD